VDYAEALAWLRTLADFERTGDFADRPDIAPMLELLRELGDPQSGRATAHIAGSKGKGSTGAMIEAVLRAAGMRTGHYVSPHLHRYTERIRVDGEPIAPDAFAGAMAAVRPALEAVAARSPGRQLLAFDALTAAGFLTFRDAAVDVQIIEAGLGGLLDSTNVFRGRGQGTADSGQPEVHVCVMTPISLEHTAILGDTVAAIARQKAGIITPGCTAVVAPQRESALDVIREAAGRQAARVVEIPQACQLQRTSASPDGQGFRLKTPRASYPPLHLPLAGRHQLDNAATAVIACEELAGRLGRDLTPEHVRQGLACVTWPGRLETIKQRPRVIIDGAHNGDSAKRMVAALRDDFGLRSAIVLFGTLGGKDVPAMAAAVAGFADAVIVSGWPSPRAADPRETAGPFREADAPVTVMASLPDAYEAALAQAGERGAVVCFGSLAFVAAVRAWVLGIAGDS
jgi:dihydrofolate synthase/folylpolyglutamate synthase